MTRALLLALSLALAAPAAAETVVAPEAFEALSEGRTLRFAIDGKAFGAEQFFPGRRTLWRFAEGACQHGTWHAEHGLICFVYDDMPAPICWRFLDTGAGYTAALVEDGAETGLRLRLQAIDANPLPCPGPEVGS